MTQTESQNLAAVRPFFFVRFTAALLLLTAAVCHAQEGTLPPFPTAAHALLPVKILAEFPKQTFLENLAVAPNGDIFVTSYPDGVVYRVTTSGTKNVFARIPGKAAGIILNPRGGLLVGGWYQGKSPALFLVSARGKITERIPLPPDAQFPNGIAYLKPDTYLVADSYRGAIWQVNVATKKVSLFLAHPLLARSDVKNSYPAVNGIKIFKGTLYATNTQQRLLLRIPLDKGNKPGVPQVFVKDVNLDDFDLDPTGNLYATTHVYNSLVRVAPNGDLTIVADAEQGMAGSTSARFGNNGDLYVTTNGGVSLPPPGGVQAAKVVRVTVPKGR